MRWLRFLPVPLIAMAVGSVCFAAPAEAQSRIALVIANSAYQGAPALNTPGTDAALVSTTLQAAGYDVTQYADLTTETMGAAFGPFIEKIKTAGANAVVFVYFSGYAVQADGDDYLVPVDTQIASADKVADATMPLSAVIKALTDVPAAARIIVLDAARDGGFGKAGGQPVAPGLALMGVPSGVLLAYSAAPGAYALDVNGANSPYANALATLMRQPGLDIEQIFKGVRLQVNEATKGTQTPWMTSALNVDVKLFAAPAAAAAAPKTLAPALGVSGIAVPPPTRRRMTKVAMRRMPADEAYRVAVEDDSLRDYQLFVETHPDYPLAGEVWNTIYSRREETLWRRALASGTNRAYWNYLKRYPNGSHAYAARRVLDARGAPMPSDYVPVAEALPAGYYDEALGLPDIVPEGFDAPPPVFFGGLAPEFIPAPRRFDQPLLSINIQAPPPVPRQRSDVSTVTVRQTPTQPTTPVIPPPSVVPTASKQQSIAPVVKFEDVQREIQKQLDEQARKEKEKTDALAKQQAEQQAALGPQPAPVLIKPTQPNRWQQWLKNHPQANGVTNGAPTPPGQKTVRYDYQTVP